MGKKPSQKSCTLDLEILKKTAEQLLNDALIDHLQEAGIILLTKSNNESLLDFYLTNELNYSVSYIVKRWCELINAELFGDAELNSLKESIENEVEYDALVWFFSLIENAHLI